MKKELKMAKRAAAVLIGNGLSLAFNPQLSLGTITQEVLQRLAAMNGTDVVKAMCDVAFRALPEGATGSEDFEVLIGAFGAESRTLGLLESLAGVSTYSDVELRDAIRRVALFAESVRDVGVSHVLEVISERSRAVTGSWVGDLVQAIVSSFSGNVTFGNLNYDTILLAALLDRCVGELADLGHGGRSVTVRLASGERTVHGLRRSVADFPAYRRVRLVHLHGSLTYWIDGRGEFVKLPKEVIEDGALWRSMRDQAERTREAVQAPIPTRPVVILASQGDKSEQVRDYPFKLAYEVFEGALCTSGHWIVIGYSFRDEPVNDALRRRFGERRLKPKVLVVTNESGVDRSIVERAFGWGAEDGTSASWLSIIDSGAEGMEETQQWTHFVEE